MTATDRDDWEPRSDAVQNHQIEAYDRLRGECGVAFSQMLGWSVFGHADVLRVVQDEQRFSSAVSRHVAVPNGMDPPEHTVYRRLIEPYFEPARIAAFRPACEGIAAELIDRLRGRPAVELAREYALPFAVRVQCAFMGWSFDLEPQLALWIERHHRAVLAGDRSALADLGQEFEALVRRLLDERRTRGTDGERDVMASLLHETVDGQPLAPETIASIVRNWTVGEIGTIAAAVGIIADWLALHPSLQERLRTEPALQPEAIDEILRLHGPLVANRRVTTCPVDIAGRTIPAHAQLVVHWTSANRDPDVFEAPHAFRFGRDPADNLLYGAGIHVCPGAGLARMELAVATHLLLDATVRLAPASDRHARRYARYPAMGFSRLLLQLDWVLG